MKKGHRLLERLEREHRKTDEAISSLYDHDGGAYLDRKVNDVDMNRLRNAVAMLAEARRCLERVARRMQRYQ